MHLTAMLFRNPRIGIACPKPEIHFSRLPIYRLVSMSFGRRRNCWTLALNAVTKGLVKGAWNRKHAARQLRLCRITRIDSALAPFGLHYESFVENLAKMNVVLDKRILSDVAVFEPRTFKCLASLVCKKKDQDGETTPEERLIRPYSTDLVLGNEFLKF